MKQSKSITLACELQAVSEQAAIICSVTGLVVPNDLPALPAGAYYSSQHVLATLAPQLLRASETVRVSAEEGGQSSDWHYLLGLPLSLKIGAFLACLTHYSKIEYTEGANAYATRLGMMGADWTDKDLTKALRWLASKVKSGKLSFAPLRINQTKGLSLEVWEAFITSVAKLEHYAANAEAKGWITLTVEEFVDQQLESFRVAKVSPNRQAKNLNQEGHDCYLDIKEWLPARTQAKAKAFCRQMATHYNGELIESFLGGIAVYFEGTSEGLLAYTEFTNTVRDLRTKAEAAGLLDSLSIAAPSTIVAKAKQPEAKLTSAEALIQLKAKLAAAKGTN